MLAYHVHLLVIDRGRFAGVRVMSRRVHRHKASGRGWPAAAHRAAYVNLIHGGQKRQPVPSTEPEEIVNRASTVCGKSDAERAGRRTSPWWPASACPARAGGAVETMEGASPRTTSTMCWPLTRCAATGNSRWPLPARRCMTLPPPSRLSERGEAQPPVKRTRRRLDPSPRACRRFATRG
jgi:hypothetical protein